MRDILSSAWTGLTDGLRQSVGLSSPFCPLYLVTAVLCCVAWLLKSQGWTAKEALLYMQQNFWNNRRMMSRDGMWALFQILFLRVPIAMVHIYLFQRSYDWMRNAGHGFEGGIEAPHGLELILSTVVTMVAIDLAAYTMHRAFHTFSGLWWIHRIHHQTEYLTPFSTFRQHPLEPFLINGARGLAAGVSLGALHILLPNCTPVWTVGGMGIGFFAYMFTVNLHHFPIAIQYPKRLSLILISPHAHHIHHSRAEEHHGKNFGVVFSFWDRMFGSYKVEDFRLGELKFGLTE